MFGFFKGASISDPVLGELTFTKGRWRGTVRLAGATIPLAMSGTREMPDANAVEAARKFAGTFVMLRPEVEAALFEHYAHYAEAIASGEFSPSAEDLVEIDAPGDVWPHVVTRFLSIKPMSGPLIMELGMSVAWDEEHTLGARFDGERFMELCGSTIAP